MDTAPLLCYTTQNKKGANAYVYGQHPTGPKTCTLAANLDYEFSYGDEVTITPRNYPFTFRRAGEMRTHYAMIGMAYVAESIRSTTMLSTRKACALQG